MLGKETLVVLANLSQLKAAKKKEPILHVRGWFHGRIEITVTRLYSRMIRRYHLPSTLQDRDLDWE